MSDKPTRSGGGSGLATLPEWAGEFREWTFDLDYLHRDRKAALARMEDLRNALQALLLELSVQPNVSISDETLMQCSEAIAACERKEADQ